MRLRGIAAFLALAALALPAGPVSAQHATPFDLQSGERAYGDVCVTCHGPDGNVVEGTDFANGIYRRSYSDDELAGIIMDGIPDTTMPPNPGMSPEQAERIVAYLRAWGEEGRVAVAGDPASGRRLFFGNGGCDACHAVNGAGSRSGPDLSQIGLELRAVELETSLREPDAWVRPEARTYSVTLANGEVVTGRLLNHDTYTVQLIDENEKLRSLSKADAREHGFVGSTMPAYGDELTDEEITDLVSFLASLQGQD